LLEVTDECYEVGVSVHMKGGCQSLSQYSTLSFIWRQGEGWLSAIRACEILEP